MLSCWKLRAAAGKKQALAAAEVAELGVFHGYRDRMKCWDLLLNLSMTVVESNGIKSLRR